MNSILSLPRALSSEMLKNKRTNSLLLAILAPTFLAVIFFLIYFLRADRFLKPENNGWLDMINVSFISGINLLFPLYLILLVTFVNNTEYKANSLKQTFCYPLSRGNIIISKIIIVQSLVLLSLLIYYVLFIGFGFIIQAKHPTLFQFNNTIPVTFLKGIAMTYLACTFMISIQFLLSLNWSSIVLAMGVGLAGFISYMILIHGWKYVYLHPYALHYLSTKGIMDGESINFFNRAVWYSLSAGIGVYIVSYFIMTKRKILNS